MRLPTILISLYLLAAPLALGHSAHERNAAFLWSLLGGSDPDEPATMHDGRATTIGSAVAEAAARAGERQLAFPGLIPGVDDAYWGDIWVIDVGPGPCVVNVLGPGSPIMRDLQANFWIYEGNTSEMGGDADTLAVINWNNAAYELYEPGHWYGVGNTDWWCVETETGHFAFPFLNGVVTAGPS